MRSLEEVPEVWGSTGRSEEKLKFGAEKVTCHRKNAGNWIQNGRMGKKIDGRTGKNEFDSSKNRPKTDPERGKTRKKWASQGKKRGRFLEKVPEIGFETGKSGKNGDLGAKKVGWGSGEKMGFNADFAMLEVAKWVQTRFSRIFFRRSLARNAEMLYLCTRNREATLLQERVTL